MTRFFVGAAAVLAVAGGVVPAIAAHAGPALSPAVVGAHITLSRTAAPPGARVIVRGTRFGRRVRVSILFDGVTRVRGTTSARGTFAITLRVPRATGGRHWIRARDTRGHTMRLPLRVVQKITARPLVIAPYDKLCARVGVSVPFRVQVTADGFGARARLPVELAGVRVRTLTTGRSGSASGAFTVPPETPGLRRLVISDPAHGFERHLVVLSQTFSCWSAVSNGSGVNWRWHGVGWDAGSAVTLGLVMADGRHVVHSAAAGPRGSFGTLVFTTACPVAGTYAVTIKGRSQGRPLTIRGGALHVFGTC